MIYMLATAVIYVVNEDLYQPGGSSPSMHFRKSHLFVRQILQSSCFAAKDF